MSVKIIKQYSAKKNESATNTSVVDRLRARRAARKAAEALVAAKKAKKAEAEGDGEVAQVDDISLDADTATVIFTDKEANVQVVVGEDPTEGGIVIAVATAEHDNLEDEEVLSSVTVGEGEAPAEAGTETKTQTEIETEEAKKQAAVEEARTAIKARLKR